MKILSILMIIAALGLIGWAVAHYFIVTAGICNNFEETKGIISRLEKDLEEAKAQKKSEKDIFDIETKLYNSRTMNRDREITCNNFKSKDRFQGILGAVLFIAGILMFIFARRKKAIA